VKSDSGVTFGQIIAALMFIGGAAAGPGYWLYSKSYSGKLLDRYEIRHTGGGFRAVSVALSPDMNPIGLAISADYRYSSSSDRSAHVSTALYDGGSRLAHGTAIFEPDKEREKPSQSGMRISVGSRGSSKTVFLDSFAVPRADNYTFQFSGSRPGESSGVRLSDMRLELRRNMKPANMKIVWTGTGALVFSLLFGWMFAPVRVEN
jgi:hypothetical protein